MFCLVRFKCFQQFCFNNILKQYTYPQLTCILSKIKTSIMQKPITNFVIIDDDSCHNIVCALSIKKIFKPVNINITGFTNATDGIAYLQSGLPGNKTKTVLFLDINMPVISGWKVLETLDSLPENMKGSLIVYMLSALVTETEKARAFSFSFVKDCIEKPLCNHLLQISEEITETALMENMYA